MDRGALRLLMVTGFAPPDEVQQAVRAADAGWALAAVPTLPAALQWLAQHTADAVLLDAAALGSQSTAAITQLRRPFLQVEPFQGTGAQRLTHKRFPL